MDTTLRCPRCGTKMRSCVDTGLCVDYCVECKYCWTREDQENQILRNSEDMVPHIKATLKRYAYYLNRSPERIDRGQVVLL